MQLKRSLNGAAHKPRLALERAQLRPVAVPAKPLSRQALHDTDSLYAVALYYARNEHYRASRVLFERLLQSDSSYCKAWVSYAMMEKRCAGSSPQERFARCRAILQRGLALNPTSACLVQAWGLMELQKCNWLAALILLERCTRLDPRLQPVLNWAQVHTARQTVCSKRRYPGSVCDSPLDTMSASGSHNSTGSSSSGYGGAY